MLINYKCKTKLVNSEQGHDNDTSKNGLYILILEMKTKPFMYNSIRSITKNVNNTCNTRHG